LSDVIYFGTNLGFARYVWDAPAALDIACDELGLRVVELVAENDFGPALFTLDREAFIRRHTAIGRHARERGIRTPTVFTFYREGGAIAHPDPAVRRAAEQSLLSLVYQAKASGAGYACAALMTASREDFEREPETCRARAMESWKRLMQTAHAAGLEGLILEMSAQAREDCATIAQTRRTLDELNEFHRDHPEITVPVHLCYDVGHGISRAEAPDDAERDFAAWFRAFPDAIREIHLKNTDSEFLATWPFTPERRGIIEPDSVVGGVRDLLKREVFLILEIAGKRGREIGEQAILKDLKTTVQVWEAALHAGGYRPRGDGAWIRVHPAG